VARIQSPFLTTPFVTGAGCLVVVTFGYLPVANSFYYGGGLPFVQLVFLAIYIIGVRMIRSCVVSRWLKWVIYLAPVVWMTAFTLLEKMVNE